MSNENLRNNLLPYWTSTVERVGLLLASGEVVELPNHSNTPEKSFMLARQDIKPYDGQAVATWHTHPENNVNLSALDYLAFLQLPNLTHYIVTETRIRSFVIRNNTVMLHEADCV